jgi:hypothetical protein
MQWPCPATLNVGHRLFENANPDMKALVGNTIEGRRQRHREHGRKSLE